ncbi:PKD domain-containing protein [Pontiellaceae bacterium B1224]|nr:PKD domain-containing protein [Pontiellaceae bacterium B1224]
MKRIQIGVTAVIVGLGCVTSSLAGIISDDFSGGLGNWTGTAILDDNGGSANTSTWQVNGGGDLELATSAYDGIEQWAYIRSGATLAVGEEAQVTVANWPITGAANNEAFGLYVGGTAPVAGTRQDYIAVYGKRNSNNVWQRGFDGGDEYGNPNYTAVGTTKLFIARVADNTYVWGNYVGETRTVRGSLTPTTANSGNVVGIYADVRAAGTVGAIESFQIVEVEPVTADIDASPLSGTAPLEVVFSGTNSVSIEPIASYNWDFGDGNTATGGVVTNTFVSAGTYMVELTVVDTLSNSNSTTRDINAIVEPTTVLMDDFSGDLSNYTMTRILNNSGGANDLAGVINSEALDFASTAHSGAADQYAFIYNGFSLAVGEEVKCDISWFKTMSGTLNSAVGLYVGKTPVNEVREDYVSVYLNSDTLIRARGFNGTSELGNASGDATGVTALFIARTGENDFQVGSYVGETRNVLTTRSGMGAGNDASAVGFYIDTRGIGSIGTMDNLSWITPNPPLPPAVGDISIGVISGGTEVTLSFLTSNNGSYGVEVRTSMTVGGWDNIITNIAGTGTEVTVTNSVSSDVEFYRAFIED